MSKASTRSCDEVRQLLPEMILAAPSQEERQIVLDHIETCGSCREALPEAFDVIAHGMLSDVDLDADVPSSIKDELMKQIRSVPQIKPGTRYDHEGVLVVRSKEVSWRPTGVPGMEWRPLSSPRFDDRSMSIFRMKAGCVLPSHRHEGQEELYMLSGTLMVQGVRLVAGDYCRADLGTTHSTVVALTDAEFLVSTDPTVFLSA